MDPHSKLNGVSIRLDALQSRIEAMIAEQLGFKRGPGMTLEQQMDAQDAACEAVEQWAAATNDNPGLVAATPLQRLLDEYLDAHDIWLSLLTAAGIRL